MSELITTSLIIFYVIIGVTVTLVAYLFVKGAMEADERQHEIKQKSDADQWEDQREAMFDGWQSKVAEENQKMTEDDLRRLNEFLYYKYGVEVWGKNMIDFVINKLRDE